MADKQQESMLDDEEPSLDNGVICTMDTLVTFLDNSSTGDSLVESCVETVEETLNKTDIDIDEDNTYEITEIAMDKAKDMLIDAARAGASHIRQMLTDAIGEWGLENELRDLVDATFSEWVDETLEWHVGDNPSIIDRAVKSAIAEYQKA